MPVTPFVTDLHRHTHTHTHTHTLKNSETILVSVCKFTSII